MQRSGMLRCRPGIVTDAESGAIPDQRCTASRCTASGKRCEIRRSRLVFSKHLALKSGGGPNLAYGLIDPCTPSTRCNDRANGIVRRVPHLFVGLHKAIASLAKPSDSAHGVSPVAFRSLSHVPLPTALASMACLNTLHNHCIFSVACVQVLSNGLESCNPLTPAANFLRNGVWDDHQNRARFGQFTGRAKSP
jgi:hypothetical protein